MEPVGDEPPRDAVIVYPSDTPSSVMVVSYDKDGNEVERERVIRARLTMGKIHRMMSRLLVLISLAAVAAPPS
jgi:hypothetical protein